MVEAITKNFFIKIQPNRELGLYPRRDIKNRFSNLLLEDNKPLATIFFSHTIKPFDYDFNFFENLVLRLLEYQQKTNPIHKFNNLYLYLVGERENGFSIENLKSDKPQDWKEIEFIAYFYNKNEGYPINTIRSTMLPQKIRVDIGINSEPNKNVIDCWGRDGC
ncbi:MAG: hypothetical protein QXV83_01360 [Candidatus Anstonellaceae archaeon]